MLRYQASDDQTLGLLRRLQAAPEFAGLRLVGGTGLALQIGHRRSIDIDLFGTVAADSLSIAKRLSSLGTTTQLSNSENMHVFSVAGVRVDVVNYHYPWLQPPVQEDGLLLAAKADIAAMKLAAITNRGSRKDFVDLCFLLRDFPLAEMLDGYSRKFPDGSVFLVLRSLAYFGDADQDEEPLMLSPHSWTETKTAIARALRGYLDAPRS